MTTLTLENPAGAPEEVVTNALVRDIDLPAFGFPGKLALITLDNGQDHNRPNTFGPKSLHALDLAITEALSHKPAAIGITGKPYIFAAGADLSGLVHISRREQALAIGKMGHDVFRRFSKIGESGTPTFAFINGLALGGGLEVGLHCDYRTLATTALTGLPEVFLGLIPGWGGATLLPKLVGPESAVQIMLLNALNNNTMMKAHEALKLGVVDAIFEPADFLEHSMTFAAQILSGKKKIEREDFTNDPAWESALARGKAAAFKKYGGADIAAPRRALELIAAARTASRTAGFDAEDETEADLTMSDELRASLYAFNLIQKKRKKVEGAPKSSLARKVAKVGVAGAGLMASQLALILVRNLKCPVVMTDLDQERVDKGVAWVHNEINKLVEKKRMSEESGRRISLLVTGSVDQKAFAGSDFVIEAIFEELSLKQTLFKKLEGIVSPECVLATNTSSLSVEAMSKDLTHPERVIGFHFFNPVSVMPLLEIARTSKTDDATTATAVAVGKELKKTMMITKDAPGFVVNRLFTRFMGEITDAMDEGTSPEVADNAMRSIGFPMSPFELLGLVGPGVALHVSETLNVNLGPRYRISPTMARMVKEGVRTFYIKDENGKLVPNPAAVALIEKGNQPSTSEEVRKRALSALAEEARMMLAEGVVPSAADIDLCMLLGAGWPLILGGILPYLDRIGISQAICGMPFHDKGVASLP
jgi:3-hydroxyacyl-CoA dehydrogenase/enoyl-CoA hydratase/carnithine racemase